MESDFDVVIIGGGPAGLAAAIEAKKTGAGSVLIIERNDELGGILPQCIHNGFGAELFKRDLPGPAFARLLIDQIIELGVKVYLDTMVLDITSSRKIFAINNRDGYLEFSAKAIVLAMGCRERTRAQIRIPGSRPAGVFTAGMVQRLVNIEGYMPGKDFVILGSGDIGMIMARRLTLEGAKVVKVLEVLPFLTGLRRNYVQCLQDFDIPLELSTTIAEIIGNERVQAVRTIRVDENLTPIKGSEQIIECDTVLLSVGLIPENELSGKAGIALDPLTGGPVVDERMATSVPGIFSAGNVVTIYDLADEVSKAGFIAGREAAFFVQNRSQKSTRPIGLKCGKNIRMLIPQIINRDLLEQTDIFLEIRVLNVMENNPEIEWTDDQGNIIKTWKRNYMRPAEMVSIKLSGKEAAQLIRPDIQDITVQIRG